MNKINNKIKTLRINRGLDQNSIAEELGISQSVYSKIENGKIFPDLNKLIRIVEIYKIDFNELFNYYKESEIDSLKNEIANLKIEIAKIKKP